jgi:hypothetical protein
MLKKIPVSQLRLGMHLHKLEGRVDSTPVLEDPLRH